MVAKTDTAILRLLCPPDSNPEARLVKAVATRNQKLHRSSVHLALGHARDQCRALTSLPEVIDSQKAGLPPHPLIQAVIMTIEDEARTFVKDNMSELPPNTFVYFSDGSHSLDTGAGAAAIKYNTQDPSASRTLSVRVGDADSTTAYQAERTRFNLAVANAKVGAPRPTLFFWFFSDNQTLIRDLTDTLQARPGMTTCLRVRPDLDRLTEAHLGSTIAIIWCPSKKDTVGLNMADKAAKAASSLSQIIASAPQPDVILEKIKQQLSNTITALPPKRVPEHLMGFFDPPATYKVLSKHKQPDATAVAQIHSGH